jgi:general secretion pathway protein A
MYEQFFGLREEPFRLTPDPTYLFLSSKHAETLAHLKLCLSESSGFVCITGDVGTGKTTLLRAFLSELGPNVSSAYTFVPPLTALELLRRICREFKLPVGDQTQGELVDQLHAYLMSQHRAGRTSVVILDEAQALSIELLEQIRLLLNLETDTQKLLRIVLVGQPQLRKLLLDPELAQLNQRITLRWHLGPLSARETAAYVRHRVSVASGAAETRLFTRPALRLIHSISGGVPRLINMIAHRALLAAYVIRTPRVNRWVIMQAYREIQAVPLPGTLSSARKVAIAAAGLAVGVGLVIAGAPQLDWLGAYWSSFTRPPVSTRAAAGIEVAPAPPAVAHANAGPGAVERPSTGVERASTGVERLSADVALAAAERPAAGAAPRDVSPPAAAAADARPAEPPVARVATTAARPAPLSPDDLVARLTTADAAATARTATAALLAAWSERPLVADEARLPDELDSVAWRRGLQHVTLTGNRSMLRLLDLPAMLTLRVPGVDTPRYAALVAMADGRVTLSFTGAETTIDDDTLERLWSGRAEILWRDFESLGPVLARGARGVGVTRLQRLLRRVGALRGADTGVFDAATEAAVIAFQRTHQLAPDGRVGPLTRVVLYGTAGAYMPPALGRRREGAA